MRITCALILLLLFGFKSYGQNDCPDAIIVCGDANYFDLEAQGSGDDGLEINPNNACASGENNSIWLKIQINQGGTLGFILTPEQSAMEIDFDFWLFGPIEQCGVIGTAIRCSTTNPLQAGLNYITTGMNDTEGDFSEGPGPDGNAFVNWITVQNNEFYYLVVDRPHGFGNFSMEWTGTATFHAVPVFLNPNNIPLDMAQCDKDGVNDQSTAFDLTVYETMFIGNQNPVAVTYHDDMNGAITGQDPILDPESYENGPNPQTIYLRMTNTVTGCYSTHSFNIEVTPPMTTGVPVNLFLCDTNENGIAEFDLTQNDTNVRSGNPATTTVTYHTSEVDALTGSNPVGPLFTNTIPYQQTLWSRLTDSDDCFSYDFYPFDLIVHNLPVFNNPNNIDINLTVCDNDGVNDNATLFDLTTHAAMLIDNQANVVISYYLNAADAEIGNNPITNPQSYTNISDPQTIYMRMLNTVTGCYDILSFTIAIERIPTGVPNDLVLCDIDENGFREFDLFENNDPILGIQTGATVTFYTSETDAINGINDIGTTYTNTVAYETQTIWARLQKDFGVCVGYGVVSFTVSIIPLPEIRNPQNISFGQTKCDLDGNDDNSTEFDLTYYEVIMKGNQANVSFSYYLTQQNAEDGVNPIANPTAFANTLNPQTIYIRLYDSVTQCHQTGSFLIGILPVPQIDFQAPLLVCDVNNDGHTEFNLDPIIQQITNDLGSAAVTMHVTFDDALYGVNDINNTNAYPNINAGMQTIYIRAESALGCIDIEPLQLIASPVPEAATPDSYPLCDDGANDTDGQATFNLVSKNDEILNGLDPTLYSVSYYISQANAVAGTPSIPNPQNYTSGNATIWARVTNNVTGCFDVVSFELIVNPLPVLITNQSTYTLCDNTLPVEIEIFDLTTKIPDYLNNEDGIAVTFHHTFDDANGGINAIVNPENYQNTEPGVETIFIRFTIEATQCYRIGFLDVRTNPLPIILEPTPEELTVCDTNGSGIGEFDLASLEEDMKNGEPGLVITFHETEQDAQNGVNAIPNTTNYVNPTPVQQIIWVRVTEPSFSCANTFMLTLFVEPAPQAPALEDLVYCDDADNNDQDGRRQVDLTVQNAVIETALGLDVPTELTVEYYTTQAAADAGVGRIIPETAYWANDDQQIWVRVESLTTGCYSLEDFYIRLNRPHALTLPTPLAQCNEALPNDAITTFDLTGKDNEILGAAGQGQSYTVNYYETDPELPGGATPIADPTAYTNPGPSAAQTLYVEVITTEGCKSYTTLTVKVLPLPVPNFSPTALQMCDSDATTGTEVFDLTERADEISANGSNYILSYYTTPEDAEAGTNAIPDPTAHQSATGQVYVRVELNSNNPAEPRCHQVVTLELIVNPLPPIANLNNIAYCEQNTDGAYVFNLTQEMNDILTAQGVDPAGYDVDFFTDAALTTPAIPVNAYPVSGGSATIWVRVIDLVTNCEIVRQLQLLVEEAAIANPVTTVFNECDYDGANDGVISYWDLTLATPDILGTQSPADYQVVYYESEADADAGTNPIPNPGAYTNGTADSMVIWAVITNTSTQSQCNDKTSFTITVERLPLPVITGGTICVDIATDAVVRPHEMNTGLDASHTFRWFLDGVEIVGETGPTLLAQAEGTYTVIATSANGCESDPSAPAVVLKSGPASAIGAGYYTTNAFSDQQTITIRIQGYGNYEYRLDDGPWQQSNIFANVSPGLHTAYIRDVNPDGCGETILIGVSIIDYPNFFTPNGDNFNDFWNVIGLDQPDAKIYIFDRYGKLLKQISAVGEGWDGTYNGEQMPATDYWFTVTYSEYNGSSSVIKEFRAHFSLLR